jgi:shikimate dehydrogenase
MRRFGLIGFPLGHSFSKKYFSEKFSREKIEDCLYENYPIASVDELPRLVSSEGVLGLNVTIPYKSQVLKFLSYIDPEASEIGAVNVIKIKRDEGQTRMLGFNSDITGIFDTLQPYSEIIPRTSLVLGSGGSSKAVCHVLGKLGFSFKVVSRQAVQGCISYKDLTHDLLQKTSIIVNTTPLGMFPDISSKPPVNYDLLNKRHVLFDLVYNPEITSFLREGKERGCTILTGLTMLYSQAERSWQIWNDPDI